MQEITSTEKRLLELLQDGLPLESRPFLPIAQELNMKEEEILDKIEDLKDRGLIRRMGGIWSSNLLGYNSQLVALRVTPFYLEEVADKINQYPGVTHNYQREHYYNLWFTVTAEKKHDISNYLAKVTSMPGVEEIMELPAQKKFKVEVKFKWEDHDDTHL